MVLLARHEEFIKARLCFAFSFIHSINQSFPIHSLHKKVFHIDFWVSMNFFFFFLLPKAFQSFLVFLKLENLCYIFSLSSPFAKKNSPRTNHLNSFCVSLLPFPKEQRTNCLNYFVSPFSLFKEFKTTQSENSFDSSLSLKKKFQRTNRLRILCPNTLEGTSFVVPVEGTSTWGLLYWEQPK